MSNVSNTMFSQVEDRAEEVRKMELINTWRSRLSFVKRHMMTALSHDEDYYVVNMAMMSELEDYLDWGLKKSHKYRVLYAYVRKNINKIKSNSRSQKIVTDCLLSLEYNHLERLIEHYGEIEIIENWMIEYGIHKCMDRLNPPYAWMYSEDGKLKKEYEEMINNAYTILA